jgi:integrase
VRKALDLLALTFVRPGTVTQAEWDEFDPDGALWTIPFKKLKQRKFRESIKELRGKPHYVSLSRQAVALLRDLKKQTGGGRYLFPGRKGRPISTNALEVALNCIGGRAQRRKLLRAIRRRMRLQFRSSRCCQLFTARTPPGRLR